MTYKEYYLSLNSIDAIKFAAESDINVAIIIGKIVVQDYSGWLAILKFVLYCVNLTMVSVDLSLYFRNRRIEKRYTKLRKEKDCTI